ncbi:phage tail tape measure protein [Lentilactobacillus buchneri]|uniref:phage tail tape measure protein n=1 Tax=Lentilactobacillus buchneri TaxID=1581 RepID=UPI00145CC58C|nr:phage tail tape measure protein [Lentilactobacillus buchneri]
MADSPYRVGYDIGAKVDYSQIKDATKAAGELINKLQKVQDLQKGRTAGSTGDSMKSAMRSTAQETQNVTNKAKTAAEAQAKLADQMKKTANSGKAMKSTAETIQTVGNHSKTAAGQVNILQRSITKVKNVGTQSFKAISDHVRRFGETSEATRKKLDRLNETGKKFRDVGYNMLPASVAVGAAFVQGAKDATKLQHRYTIIRNLIKTGGESTVASVKNTKKMMSQGRDMSLKYGISQESIAKGYESLVRRGYQSNQALAAQKTYLQGSIASGDKYSDVVTTAASAIESFGLKSKNTIKMTENTKKAVNQMAYAADLTATSFSDLGEAMKFAGPDAYGAHQTLSQTSAAIGELSNAHIEGSQAGTSLRQIYQRLINPPQKGKAPNALKQLGLNKNSFRDAKNNLLPIADIFDKLSSRMKGMSRTQRGGIYAALFGANASSAANVLGTHVKQLKELTGQVAKAQKQGKGGYVAGLSQKNLHSWQNQFKRFKTSVDQLGMSFAKSVLPTLTPMVEKLNNLVTAFGKLPKPMKEAVAYGTAFVALAGPLTVGVGSMMSTAAVLGIGASKSGSGIGKLVGKAGKAFLPAAAKDVEKVPKFLRPAAGELGGLTKTGRLLEGTKGLARRIPLLGTAISATSLIGINKHNAGRKIGDFGGSVAGMTAGASAGAALGSVIPGLGTAVGGLIGGAAGGIAGSSLGKTVGGWFQKQIPGIKKSVIPIFKSVGKWIGKEWKSAGKFVGGIGSWFKGVGKGIDKKVIKPVAGAFKSVIKTAGKLKSGVAHAIAAPFEFAVGLVHRYIVKPLKKPVTAVLNWIRKKWKAFSKTTGNLWHSIGSAVGRAWRSGLKVVSNVWKSTSRWLGKAWNSFASTVGKYWEKITSPIKKVWHSAVGYVKSLWNGATNWLSKEWHGLSKSAGNIFTAVGDAIKRPIKAAWDYISNIFGKIGNAVGNATKSVGKVFDKVAKWAGGVTKEGKHTLGAHANGGLITFQHNALVGEAGPELAYTVNGRKARILGAAGPHITKVKPGERILNARDTAKVMGGGLGHALPGYATGTTSLGTQKADKSVDKFSKQSKTAWSKTEKDTSKSTKKINKNTVGDYDTMQKNSAKQLTQLKGANSSAWKSIYSNTSKRTNSLRKSTVSDFNSMQQGSQKQMNQLESGIVAAAKATAIGFGKEMARMKGYAHAAMSGAIGQLNQGISGIDSVLSQFGGNKSVIKPIKYAHGSNGRLPEDQLAMVNDAQSGPRQEMIVRNNNLYMPQGHNRVLPLKKGDQVLNGRQTQTVAASYGIQHYAKGSGVSDSTLRKIAKTNAKDPSRAFNKDFTVHVDLKGSDLQRGTTALEKRSTTKLGVPWSNAMWGMIEGLIKNDVSSNASMVKAMKKYGSGHRYVWGASGPDSFDCSGLVMYALRKAFGISVPHNSAAQYHDTSVFQHISPSSAKPGDALFWGPGSHVGIYEGHGKYYSAFSPKMHPNIGSYPVHGYGGDGQLLAARIKGVPNGSSSKKSKKNPLDKLVRRELGKSAISWIDKNLQIQPAGDFGGQMGGSSITKAMIEKAEKIMKVPQSIRGRIMKAILGTAMSETGNQNEMQKIHDVNSANGNPAGGPLQFTKSTFMNYAVAGHKNWANPYDQVLAFLNNSDYKNATGMTTIWGHRKYDWLHSGPQGHRRFANGGWAGKASIFGEVAGEPEVAINPKRKSADNLIDQTIEARATADKSSPSADYLNSIKALKVKHSRPKIEPKITLNFNGDISDEKTMNKAVDKFKRGLTDVLTQINDEFGLDDSVW